MPKASEVFDLSNATINSQVAGMASGRVRQLSWIEGPPRWVEILTESLILAQDEHWRHASYMQVERGPSGLPEKT